MELLMSEEVRPFEEYKEMIKDMRKEEMIKGLYDLSANIMEKQKEIERLNNIINEIENHFEFLKMNSTGGNKEFMEDILNFIKALKELKGEDKE